MKMHSTTSRRISRHMRIFQEISVDSIDLVVLVDDAPFRALEMKLTVVPDQATSTKD